MAKTVKWQRNMSAMEIREDFLEADGTELKSRSLRSARNMRALATGGVEPRPGLVYVRAAIEARQSIELTPADGVTVLLMIFDHRLLALNSNGSTSYDDDTVPWDNGSTVWVVPAGAKTIIGVPGVGIYLLEYRQGEWAFGSFTFGVGAGNARLQPYWNFEGGVTLEVSGTTGTVDLEFSGPVLTDEYVGSRIRYLGREITVTDYLSGSDGTLGTGTVVSKLPPSFSFTVASTANMRVKDAVEQSASGYQGIITSIVNATTVRVATLENFEGPVVGGSETLSFPSGSTDISAKSLISPQPVEVWDEPLMSEARGWPRAATMAGGRLVMADFPQAPNVIALSAAGAFDDFEVGVEDDDAIVRSMTDGSRIRHVVNAGDLLILATRGAYVVTTREGNGITPLTFKASLFDERGTNAVRPIYVNDAVIWVDSGGRNLVVAVLDGGGALRWTARYLSTFHADIIKEPVALCGPAASSASPEKYAFVVNSDGTLAVISWLEGLGAEGVGFAPWDTPEGRFLHVAAAFGTHYAIIDREIDGETDRLLERFVMGVYLDSCVSAVPSALGAANHLRNVEVAVCWNRRDAGDAVVAADGSVPGFDHIDTNAQIGLNFTAEASPWPVEVVESPRVGTFTARVIRFMVSVRESGPFQIRCNGDVRTVGGYSFGDVLASPSPLETDVRRAPVFGRRTHPDLAVVRVRPGPLRILAFGQEVQA